MAGTANDDNTPKELPLDSPNWITAWEAHRRISSLSGNEYLSAKDLSAAVADGVVPCMRRAITNKIPAGHDRARVPLSFWERYEFYFFTKFGPTDKRTLAIVERGSRNAEPGCSGWWIYVWRPALAKIWPSLFRAYTTTDAGTAGRSRQPVTLMPTPVEPKELFDELCEEHPQKSHERPSDYARRLHALMEVGYAAGKVSRVWDESTVRRRLYDRG